MKDIFRQTWWQSNLPERLEQFTGWVGNADAPSKVAVRRRVIAAGHRSILDCGCGLCADFDGYRDDGYAIEYHGVDATPVLVERARARGIDVVHGYLERLPFPDGSVDVVSIRHVLEHLPDHREALAEAVRVARREVLVVFFLKPHRARTVIAFDPAENLYHNVYNRGAIGRRLGALPRVRNWRWTDLNDTECLLAVTVA